MIFTIITFLSAFLIEGLGTLVSVIGLSTLFGANPIIIALAIALDVGKLVVVSLLYKYWDKLGVVMRSYAFIAAAVTMTITSAGAAGYLSGEFQKAIMGTQEGSLKVNVLKEQQAKYEERKKQIDAQIAALPEKTTVTQRLRLMNGFKAEQKDLQDKIGQIDKDLPALQIQQIGTEAKAGPILYIAKAFDIPVESAVKWVILMIIFVFDPLAVFLIIAGNFLLEQYRRKPKIQEQFVLPVLTPEIKEIPESIVVTEAPQEIKEPEAVAEPQEVDDTIQLAEVAENTEELIKDDREIQVLPVDEILPEQELKAETNDWLDQPIGEQLPAPEPFVPEPEETAFIPDEVVIPEEAPPVLAPPGAPDEVTFTKELGDEEPIELEESAQVSPEREQITLDQLKPKLPISSLSDVAVDNDSITFDEAPRPTNLGMHYNMARRS